MNRRYHPAWLRNGSLYSLASLVVLSSSLAALADDAKAVARPASKPVRKLSSVDTSKEQPVTYQVRQVVKLDQIESDAQKIRMWVSIPGNDPCQRLLDLDVVSAPAGWKIVSDADHRGQFLYVEVDQPQTDALEVEIAFTVHRQPLLTKVDPDKSGPLTEAMKAMYAEHLVLDAPHMKVTPKIQKIADELCGDETNVAVQALLLLQHVASAADHYSYAKDPDMPKCGIGDSEACLSQGGGCCTDLHSLFVALARSRGVPARVQMGYRLEEKNLGKLVDPGYRCWVEYFAPHYGWVSADIVEADNPTGLGINRWLSGLTARRVWLNQGREFKLADDQAVERVNHMSIAYAEIDGKPVRLLPEGKLQPQVTRQVEFQEVPAPTTAKSAAK